MSRRSLPSTPLIHTPTLSIPSPTRTPSPLPLFSTGGPISYSGQITRKYTARFNHIDKTRNTVKDVEEAWTREAKGKGMGWDQYTKSIEEEYINTWEDHGVSVMESMKVDIPRIQLTVDDPIKVGNKRMSFEGDHFVDALTSPLEKPKDWDLSLPKGG